MLEPDFSSYADALRTDDNYRAYAPRIVASGEPGAGDKRDSWADVRLADIGKGVNVLPPKLKRMLTKPVTSYVDIDRKPKSGFLHTTEQDAARIFNNLKLAIIQSKPLHSELAEWPGLFEFEQDYLAKITLLNGQPTLGYVHADSWLYEDRRRDEYEVKVYYRIFTKWLRHCKMLSSRTMVGTHLTGAHFGLKAGTRYDAIDISKYKGMTSASSGKNMMVASAYALIADACRNGKSRSVWTLKERLNGIPPALTQLGRFQHGSKWIRSYLYKEGGTLTPNVDEKAMWPRFRHILAEEADSNIAQRPGTKQLAVVMKSVPYHQASPAIIEAYIRYVAQRKGLPSYGVYNKRKGKKGWRSGDYKKFDQQQNPNVMEAGARVLSDLDPPGKDEYYESALNRPLLSPTHDPAYDAFLIQRRGGVPSGIAWTSLLDSLANVGHQVRVHAEDNEAAEDAFLLKLGNYDEGLLAFGDDTGTTSSLDDDTYIERMAQLGQGFAFEDGFSFLARRFPSSDRRRPIHSIIRVLANLISKESRFVTRNRYLKQVALITVRDTLLPHPWYRIFDTFVRLCDDTKDKYLTDALSMSQSHVPWLVEQAKKDNFGPSDLRFLDDLRWAREENASDDEEIDDFSESEGVVSAKTNMVMIASLVDLGKSTWATWEEALEWLSKQAMQQR